MGRSHILFLIISTFLLSLFCLLGLLVKKASRVRYICRTHAQWELEFDAIYPTYLVSCGFWYRLLSTSTQFVGCEVEVESGYCRAQISNTKSDEGEYRWPSRASFLLFRLFSGFWLGVRFAMNVTMVISLVVWATGAGICFKGVPASDELWTWLGHHFNTLMWGIRYTNLYLTKAIKHIILQLGRSTIPDPTKPRTRMQQPSTGYSCA